MLFAYQLGRKMKRFLKSLSGGQDLQLVTTVTLSISVPLPLGDLMKHGPCLAAVMSFMSSAHALGANLSWDRLYFDYIERVLAAGDIALIHIGIEVLDDRSVLQVNHK